MTAGIKDVYRAAVRGTGVLAVVAGLMTAGCTSVSILKTGDILSIEKGVTTKDGVVKLLGRPTRIRADEFIYQYANATALKGEISRQETRIAFDSSEIVGNVSFVEDIKGEGFYTISEVQQALMPLRAGTVRMDSVKARITPSMFTRYFENGSLRYSSLTFRTASDESRPLANARHITTVPNRDGYYSYLIYFTPDGMLRNRLQD